MKLNSFQKTFIDTLILNVATISAIVVGIVQFAVRSYNENNGNEKVRKVMQTVLQFVDTLIDQGKTHFADPVVDAVPVDGVPQGGLN
jgi:F0F1-type ATP synthase membrane subunit a